MKKEFTVKDLFEPTLGNGTFDVYGSIADEIGIAFVLNSVKLTEEGLKKFKDVLDIRVEINGSFLSVKTHEALSLEEQNKYEWDNYESYHPLVQKLSDLMYCSAGYCSKNTFEKYFTEIN